MRILVTGASGVFGRDLCARLRRSGHDVVGLARRRPVGLAVTEFAAGDILDGAVVEKAMTGCDVVAHLAWAVTPLRTEEENRAVNIGGTTNVLEAMARTGCGRLVFSSSCTAYGSFGDSPLFLTEEHPLRARAPQVYPRHKRECEELIESTGVDALRTRSAVVVGRSVDNYVFEVFAGPAVLGFKGSEARWQFVHQDDVGRFHARACTSDRCGVVNLAAPDVLSGVEVARILERRYVVMEQATVERLLRAAWRLGLVNVDPNEVAGLRYMPVVSTRRLQEDWAFTCAWSSREALTDLARSINRSVQLGTKRLEKRWRVPWAPPDVPADLSPLDGGELARAGPAAHAGSLDTAIDPRYPIYTTANVSEAFPGPMTPLSLELSMHSLRGSAHVATVMLPLLPDVAAELRARAVGVFGHRLYVNVSVLRAMAETLPGWTPEDIDEQYLGIPVPEGRRRAVSAGDALTVLRLLARLAPRAVGMDQEIVRLAAELGALAVSTPELEALGEERLDARIRLLHDLTVQGWTVAANGTLFAGAVSGLVEQALGEGAAAGLRGAGEDLASMGALKGVVALAAAARQDPAADHVLRATADPYEALAVLATAAPGFWARFQEVLAQHGHRGPGETELANPVFADAPALLLGSVRRTVQAPLPPTPAGVGVPRRLRPLVHQAHAFLHRRERARDVVIRATHELRRAVRERGRRMARAGLFAEEDVFYLSFAELSEPGPDAATAVAERRLERERLQRLRLPEVFTGRWEPLRHWDPPLRAGDSLRGLAASPGRVRGVARIVRDGRPEELQPGEVLVAHVTDTGWTPMFAYAAAVVTDVGAMASHAAIVAREFGIPCVVGTGEASTRLRDGQLLEVDGGAGTVTAVADRP